MGLSYGYGYEIYTSIAKHYTLRFFNFSMSFNINQLSHLQNEVIHWRWHDVELLAGTRHCRALQCQWRGGNKNSLKLNIIQRLFYSNVLSAISQFINFLLFTKCIEYGKPTVALFVPMHFRSREQNDHTVNVRSRERKCGRFVPENETA